MKFSSPQSLLACWPPERDCSRSVRGHVFAVEQRDFQSAGHVCDRSQHQDTVAGGAADDARAGRWASDDSSLCATVAFVVLARKHDYKRSRKALADRKPRQAYTARQLEKLEYEFQVCFED